MAFCCFRCHVGLIRDMRQLQSCRSRTIYSAAFTQDPATLHCEREFPRDVRKGSPVEFYLVVFVTRWFYGWLITGCPWAVTFSWFK